MWREKKHGRKLTRPWRVVWRDPATGRRSTHAFETKPQAATFRAWAEQKELEAKTGKDAPDRPAAASPSVVKIIPDYLKHYRRHVSEGTAERVTRILTRFAAECPVSLLGSITVDHLADHIAAGDYAPRTQHKIASALSGLFKWAIRRGHVATNPTERLELPRPDLGPIDYLTRDEYQQLLDGAAATPARTGKTRGLAPDSSLDVTHHLNLGASSPADSKRLDSQRHTSLRLKNI